MIPDVSLEAQLAGLGRALALQRQVAAGGRVSAPGPRAAQDYQTQVLAAAQRSFSWLVCHAGTVKAVAALPADLRACVLGMEIDELRVRLGCPEAEDGADVGARVKPEHDAGAERDGGARDGAGAAQ